MRNWLSNFPVWKRNLYILWFGTFMVGVASSEVTPFLSLFTNTLGHFTEAEVNLYAGIAFSATFLMTAIVSPIWGRLADRVGRKPMLLRAAFGMAIVQALTGFVTNVWQLILLRLLMGLFNGYISNANALVAKDTPHEESGPALGFIATGFTSGSLLGPLFGGFLADTFGFRLVFILTGVILLLVGILTQYGVTEDKTTLKTRAEVAKQENPVRSAKYPSMLIGLFVTTMFIQIVTTSINPILANFVKHLLGPGATNVSLIAGLVSAAPGITTVLFATKFGRLGNQIGTEKMVMFGFLIGISSLVPSAFVTSVWVLIIFRLMMGLTNATMNPAIQTILSQQVPSDSISRIFSYNQSFQSIGNMAGPLIGSFAANSFGYKGVFLTSALIMFINMIFFYFNTKPLRTEHKKTRV